MYKTFRFTILYILPYLLPSIFQHQTRKQYIIQQLKKVTQNILHDDVIKTKRTIPINKQRTLQKKEIFFFFTGLV